MTYENFTKNIDIYMFVHFAGWFCISFLCKDFYLLTAWQVYDEITELAHRDYLNLFNECWWDKVIQDIFGSNLFGIVIGLLIQQRLDVKPYDFLGRKNEDGTKRKFRDWRVWHCHRHFGYLLLFFITFHFNFLNRFFVANSFYVPLKSNFCKARLFFMLGVNYSVFKYVAMDLETWGKKERLESHFNYGPLVLSSAFTLVETLIEVSYLWEGSFGVFVNNPDFFTLIVVPWILMACYWIYLRSKQSRTVEIPEYEREEFELSKLVR